MGSTTKQASFQPIPKRQKKSAVTTMGSPKISSWEYSKIPGWVQAGNLGQ